jgi:hypothetical protein
MAETNTDKATSQSSRFLEAAKKAGATEKSFQQAMGKMTLQKQGRKPSKIG